MPVAQKRKKADVQCDRCGHYYKALGIANHRRKCDAKEDATLRDREIERQIRAQEQQRRRDVRALLEPVAGPSRLGHRDPSPPHAGDLSMQDAFDIPGPIEPPATPPPEAQKDDIRTVHHPHTNKPNQTDAFHTYTWNVPTPPPVNDSQPPWSPWGSLAAFNLADIILRAALPNKEIDNLLSAVHTLVKEQPALPFKNHQDVHALWDQASKKLTSVRAI